MNVQIFTPPTTTDAATRVIFAPMLAIPNGTTDVSFYTEAFGAVELRRFGNDDGSVHVSEFTIGDTMFHLHEETPYSKMLSPQTAKCSTVTIGLFVDDVHAVIAQAVAAGAKITSPVQDYDYGYRQGNVVDPFGHNWQIQSPVTP